MLTMSALRRLAASSKEMRVRVLGSMKRLTRVLPWSAGTFFTSRVPTSLKASAVLSTRVISSAESSRRLNKSFRTQRVVIVGPRPAGLTKARPSFLHQPDGVRLVVCFLQPHPHAFALRGGQVLSHKIGANRQFTVATINQNRELDRGR